MTDRKFLRAAPVLACLCCLVFAASAHAQFTSDSIHAIEVRLRAGNRQVGGVRVRLIRQSRMQPVGETFSGQSGQVSFTNLLPGEYIVETFESEGFEATATRASILPVEFRKPTPMRVYVTVDLPARRPAGVAAPGVVAADVDLDVPAPALRHYRKGEEALRSDRPDEAIRELKAAVEAHPGFYAARLALGRALRAGKHFREAEEVLKALLEIAPGRAEGRLEYALALLAQGKQKEAARELLRALELEEANWVTHLHLGWALLEDEPGRAARHFARALELGERKAAQAHLSLARLAHARGMRGDAIRHLEAYLALAPEATDAPAVRKLLGQLKK